MKRTAATLALLAGFGGGCASTDNSAKKENMGGFGTVTRGQTVPGVVGPSGEPIVAARGTAPSGAASSGVVQAGGTTSSGGIQQVGLLGSSSSSGDCPTCAHVPGTAGMPLWHGEIMSKFYAAANGMPSGGQPGYGGPVPQAGHGILPVPGQGPPGAVAAVGALPFVGGQAGVALSRTSVRFTGPAGMKITWQMPGGRFNEEATGLTAPKEYNFMQGQIYRLRLTQILPNFPGRAFYPTLEVAPGNPKTLTFLAHSSVPLTFTNEDFEQARAGNLVVKVVYLPDRENQDFATVAGAEELVSTRLEPGADPVAEAQRRGSILAVIRMGNIDLENHASPPMVGLPSAVPPRSGPIMLPGPMQTTPPAAPLAPPKPVVPPAVVPPAVVPPPGIPVVPPKPPAGGASSNSGSGSSTTGAAMPFIPLIAQPAGSAATGSSSLPASLPSIVPSGPGSGSSTLTLPPTK